MSAIRAELMKAANVTPKRGESEVDFHKRMVKAISEDITEETWQGLSSEAQDWNNVAADAFGAGKEPPAFPDAAASPTATVASDAPTGRKRGAGATAKEKKGDRVVITTKRGKAIEGVIVEMDEEGYVLNKDGEDGKEEDDVEVPLGTVASIALSNTAEAAAAGPTTEAAGGGVVEPEVPEVGDTIQVKTKRGKVIMGKLTEVEGDDIVLKDTQGEEHELQVSKLETWTMKAKGKPAEAAAATSTRRKASDSAPAKEEEKPAGRRRGAAAEAPAEGDKPKRASNEKGVSVSHRINEIMIDNPDITQEKLGATLKKEGIEFRDNTLNLNYTAAQKFLKLLKEKGKLK